MNSLAKLIKAKVISFRDLILENYAALGLDEVEALILINLNRQKENGDSFLKVSELISKMSINENFASEKIVRLVQLGFISLEISDDGTEKYSIDNTYAKLGVLLEKGRTATDDRQKRLQDVVLYAESLYAKGLTASELEIINNWIDEGSTYEEMTGAIMESMKAKKMHLRYADVVLINRKKQAKRMEDAAPDPALKEILDKVYVKKR
jgi:DNA replication protein DnaD